MVVFENNLGWADKIARAIHRKLPPSFDLQDLEQEARIKLWACAQRYNGKTGVPFQAFAYMAVRGAVLMSIRRRAWTEATFLDLMDTHVDPRLDIEGCAAAAKRARDRRRQADYNLRALSAIAPAEVCTLQKLYLDESEDWEVAEHYGVTVKEITRQGKKAVRVLRLILAEGGPHAAERALVA